MAKMSGLPDLQYGRSQVRPVGVVGQDTGAGDLFRSLAHTASQLGDMALEKGVEQAKKAGERSVTRDADGNIVVQKPDYLLPVMNEAHQNAAELRYAVETDKDIDRELADAHFKHANDPEGFEAAVEGIRTGKMGKLPNQDWANDINDRIDRRSLQHLTAIRNDKYNADIKASAGAIDAKLDDNANDLYALTEQGNLHSPEAQRILSQSLDLIRSKVDNPAFKAQGYTPEQADLDVREFKSKLEAGAILGQAERIFKTEGADSAVKWLKDQINDTSLELDPKTRGALQTEGLSRLNGLQQDANQAVTQSRDLEFSRLNLLAEQQKLPLDEINKALEDGRITPAAHRSLVDKVIRVTTEDGDLTEAMQQIAGGYAMDSQNSTHRKAANKVFEGAVAQGADPLAVTVRMAQTNGIIPDKPMSVIRGGLMSNDPRVAVQGLEMGRTVIENAPDAFARMPGGPKMAEDVELYRHYLEDLNMDPNAAAQRIIDFRDPARQRQSDIAIKGAQDKINKLTVQDALSSSGNNSLWGMLTFSNPNAGFTEGQSNEVLADYKALITEHLRDGMDFDAAKTKAGAALMHDLYGVSNVFGSKTLMKYPPENRYPKVNGSWDYIRQQAAEDATRALNRGDGGASDMPVGLLEPASPNANDAAQYPNGVGALRPYKVTEGGSTYQVLLPVGKGESTEQAVERYKQTGNHFGKFDSAEHATAHAKQLTAPDKKGRTVNPEDVFLIWDSNTATDWKQGRPPRYTLAIRDADGTFMTLPSGGWAPDPKRAQGGTKTKEQFDLERAKAKSMTKAAKEAAQAAPVY